MREFCTTHAIATADELRDDRVHAGAKLESLVTSTIVAEAVA